MRIIHIASEMAPIAKVGGMADVILGLSRATIQQNHDLAIILPKYSTIQIPLEKVEEFSSSFDGKLCQNTIWKGEYESIPLLLIEPELDFFRRHTIYGQADDADRFAYFSKVVASYLSTQLPPDVIHVHDWHTALVSFLYRKCRSIFTIHNLAYKGECGFDTLRKIGLTRGDVEPLAVEDYYSLLQAGIVAADHITTVSPTYAKEILQKEQGGILCPLLNKYAHKLSGILNGIDYSFWNPEQDPLLPFHYNLQSLTEKRQIQDFLRKKLKLKMRNSLIVSSIARLVPQKGPDLIEAALRKTIQEQEQFILLGSSDDPKLAKQFKELKKEFADNPNVHIELVYNEELAHLVYAASDLLVVPSIFEPCGLTQMIAMRYGAIPLVRQTGGLADTVFEDVNGFSFQLPTKEALSEALSRAFSCKKNTPEKWNLLVVNGMQKDFSWQIPASQYLTLYIPKQPEELDLDARESSRD